MNRNLVAKAETDIGAPASRVWQALVDPEAIRQYMFGTDVTSDWREGSAITWKGKWNGKAYEDKGRILEVAPGKRLRYSHFSPMMGLPDAPENYHEVTIDLAGDDKSTHVSLVQDNNADDKAREHSEKNWSMMLDGLKHFVEDPKG